MRFKYYAIKAVKSSEKNWSKEEIKTDKIPIKINKYELESKLENR